MSKKKEAKPDVLESEIMESESVIDTEEDAEAVEAVEVLADEVEESEEKKALSLEDQLLIKEDEIKMAADRHQRTMAEFDNFRKRSMKEKAQMYESGAKEVLDKLLPVVDNFERAFDVATDEHKGDPFVKGIDMIYKQVIALLDDLGVEEIEALNQPFDPALHHAVQHEESEDHDDNTVVAVYQKGYTYKDSVLRYSMVKVVN